jgi:glycosyltransferase involved in cell wall biosynthesis
MRVLHALEPGSDGVFRHVERLIYQQSSRGLFIALAFSSKRSSDQLKALVRKVEELGGPAYDLRVGNTPELRDASALVNFIRLVRSFSPDLIHCHSSKAGILGRVAGALTGVPAVYTPHAYYSMRPNAGLASVIFNRIERRCAGLGHTINVSQDEAVYARECLGVKPDRQSVIPNAVDSDVFRPASAEEMKQNRLAHGIPADGIIIGTLGRFCYQKDPLTLYRAFELVARHRRNVYLAHLGSGELAEECEKWIKNAGLTSRILRSDYSSEPSEFYRLLDAFVMSSRYEGLSFAVLEAMATNLPLVLTDVPGNRDFFKLGLSHVWTAPAENPAALAQAIGHCVESLRIRAVCNHRQLALERFSEQSCSAKIADLYARLARRPKTSFTFV